MTESEQLNKHFVALLNATVSVLRVNVPGTSWHRGLASANFLRNWLASKVETRLASESLDFFTELCKLSQDADAQMSITEVIDHTVLLLFAAHDTTTSTLCSVVSVLCHSGWWHRTDTTSTLCSVVSVLCHQPEWQQRLADEISALDVELLSLDDFEKMPLTDQFFKEVLRRYPPIFVILRRCIEAFEYNGMLIPANTQTNVNINVLHHNSDLWTDPQRFDPDRFSPERAEHRQDLFQYLPFGGGAHKCLGINFAEIQTKVFLFHLLKRYRVKVDASRELAFNHMPMPLPKDKLPLTLTKA